MKPFFQLVRGIVLALILFEALVWAGSKVGALGAVVGAFPVPAAAAVLLLCLYLTFVRKSKALRRVRRKEYLVTVAPGAYGRIGGEFDRRKYGALERLPGGWATGVRTYRTEGGALLFTVRQGKLSAPIRPLCALLAAILLLGPLHALSYVNEANRLAGQALAAAGLTRHPYAMSYLDVPAVELPQLLSDLTNSAADTTDAADTGEQTEPETETAPSTGEQTDESGAGGVVSGAVDTVRTWADGVGDWFSGLFGDGDDLLPSDRRTLTDSDVEGMDAAAIQRAINEMYARHGYDLSNSADAAYFEAQSWYEPDPNKTQDDVRAEFNETEIENLHFLISWREKLRT